MLPYRSGFALAQVDQSHVYSVVEYLLDMQHYEPTLSFRLLVEALKFKN
jgi:hypothetical protein